MKNHNTFPGEQTEMPAPEIKPEISQPTDPNEPGHPQEAPDQIPQEIPQTGSPSEDPPLNPGSIS